MRATRSRRIFVRRSGCSLSITFDPFRDSALKLYLRPAILIGRSARMIVVDIVPFRP
jgi:hypothetical protein